MAKAKKVIPTRRAEGWTAFTTYSGTHTVIRADGEIAPMGYTVPRPATKAEIKAEQKKRADEAEERSRIAAFRARPDYADADDIRSSIETMEHDNHPLDKLTPDEWRALRIKICGLREGDA
jgi:hypothetical protein